MGDIFSAIKENTLDLDRLNTLLVVNGDLLFNAFKICKLSNYNFYINPLTYAVVEGNESALRLLLEHGAKPKSQPWDDWTPLHYAAYSKNVNIANILLQQGLNIEAVDSEGYTPLLNAIDKQNTPLLQLLLEHGANPNCTTEKGYTPLHEAVAFGNVKMAQALIEAGANVNAVDSVYADTALYISFKYPEIVSLLLDSGANFNIRNNYYSLPLHGACISENMDTAKLLLDAGADPNGEMQWDPFVWTNWHSWVELSAWLWGQAATHAINTPLNIAVMKHNVELAKLLLTYGADPELQIERTESALSKATRLEDLELIAIFEAHIEQKSETLNASDILGSDDIIPGLDCNTTMNSTVSNTTVAAEYGDVYIQNNLLPDLSVEHTI
jgi:ankyrin repeat protein